MPDVTAELQRGDLCCAYEAYNLGLCHRRVSPTTEWILRRPRRRLQRIPLPLSTAVVVVVVVATNRGSLVSAGVITQHYSFCFDKRYYKQSTLFSPIGWKYRNNKQHVETGLSPAPDPPRRDRSYGTSNPSGMIAAHLIAAVTGLSRSGCRSDLFADVWMDQSHQKDDDPDPNPVCPCRRRSLSPGPRRVQGKIGHDALQRSFYSP